MYVIYCIALHFNSALEMLVQPFILKLPIKLPTREEQSALVTFKNAPDATYNTTQSGGDVTSPQQELKEAKSPDYSNDANSSWDPNAAWTDDSKPTKPAPVSNSFNSEGYDSWGSQNYGYIKTEGEAEPDAPQEQKTATATTAIQPKEDYYKPSSHRPDHPDPLVKPEGGNQFSLIFWYITYPIHFMCKKTMVDVRQEQYKHLYPLTFLISMIWISFYSYFMVWMITIIGYTLGIPDTVMGLTFVAAGVSVPDALSSIAVIKEGYGDMAVSNAVGSNVFDILVCLGLPW
jgi:Ca2+/Na+ antiporter